MNKKWIDYFFNICDTVAEQSKDLNTKVGAVLIGEHKQVIGTAYNGFPMGVMDDIKGLPARYSKKYKYLYTCHAEENIVALAARHGVRTDGSVLFVNQTPCIDCTRLIIQAGIKEVHFRKTEGTGEWRQHLVRARGMFEEANIKIYGYEGEIK